MTLPANPAMRSGRMLFVLAVGAAALSGLLFGFDTAVVAGVTADLSRVFTLGPEWLGVTVSAALWGTLIGALGAGALGDRFGSRLGLRVMALFYFISAIGCALAPDWYSFVLSRVIGGIAIGGSSVLAPVYIAEIAPTDRRGRLVALFQLSVVAGILLAYVSNAVIGTLLVEASQWRWKLGVAAVPAALLIVLFGAIPHSPRWLLAHGRADEATAAAASMGIVHVGRSTSSGGVERFSWRAHRKPILLAMGLAAFNQLSGINAILYYLNDIFASAGYGALSSAWQAVAIGIVNLVFTLVGLILIDRAGRRNLLAFGGAGMTVCLALVAIVMSGLAPRPLLLWALIGFIAFFAMSQGAVIWVYVSEIFPQDVRARGASLGSATHWFMNAVISAAFPAIAALSASGPFVFFALMMLAMTVIVLTLYPETRGVALEDVAFTH